MESRIFRDLRDYLSTLEELGRLKRVEGAEWNLEIGILTQLIWRKQREDCPVLLFDEIVGYESGRRVMTLGVSSTFLYTLASNLPLTTDRREAIVALKDRVQPEPIPPRNVSEGEILENVMEDPVDVTAFPAPKFKQGEGGRFIGTGDVVITRHADREELNAGTYRCQIHGPEHVTLDMGPGRHGREHVSSFIQSGRPAPVVISVGQSPDLFLAACERFAEGVDELSMVGGRRGEPVEVVEDPITGLPMPAQAELVLSGHFYPGTTPVKQEGPFGEFTGYYAGVHYDMIPLTVERVYFRNDPIIFAVPHHRPPQDVILDFRIAPRLWKELEESGIPGVREVESLPFGSGMCNVVSVNTQYPGHGRQLGLHVASAQSTYLIGYVTIVVDEDIDIYDTEMVLWAVLTRCDPERDIHIVGGMTSFNLDPLTHNPVKKRVDDQTRSRIVYDATRPYHWKDEFPQTIEPDESLKKNIRKQWEEELF